MRDFRLKPVWYFVGVLLVANLVVELAIVQSKPANFLEIHFFDVGQGDSIYFRTPSGNDVLIDGGPEDRVLSKLGRVMPFADRKIEFVILTHPHADHVSGLVAVLKRYEVDNILVSEIDYDSDTYREFQDLLIEHQDKVIRPKLGQRIILDENLVLDVLYPLTGIFPKPPKDVNEVSTVARLSFGKTSILFTGDAGKTQENLLVALGLPLDSKILKVGHQGSKTSSDPRFLAKISPEYSVIMVGENNYGHPHEAVLGALADAQTEVLRTDEEGDVVFLVFADGEILRSE